MGNADLTNLFFVTFFGSFVGVYVYVWFEKLIAKLEQKKAAAK